MKKKLVLKPFIVPMLYTIVISLIVVALFYSVKLVEEKDNITYVSNAILDEYIPVVGEVKTKILKPYTDPNVTVLNSYYDYTTDNNTSAT